jgi:hypothetical protein
MEQHGISHDMQLNDTLDALTPNDSDSAAATAAKPSNRRDETRPIGQNPPARQVVMSKPRIPRHNPMADIPPVAGGLEQIIDIQERNASLPFRPAVVDGTPAPSPQQPGATGDRALGETFMK